MSCRSTACGSVATTYARILNARHLPDAVTVSTFHELRRLNHANEHECTQDDYQRLLDEIQAKTVTHPGFTPKRRESLLTRIRAARNETPTPDLIYAALHIGPALKRRATAIDTFTRSLAARTSEDPEVVRERFIELVKDAPRTRTHRTQTAIDDKYTPFLTYGIGQDQGVLYAAYTLNNEARVIEAHRSSRLPRRIDNHTTADRATPLEGVTISKVGTDPRNGRAEVTLTTPTGARTTHYTNVDTELLERLHSPQAGEVWYTHLRGNPAYLYASEHEALLDGAAPRCDACGQYASTSHECPVPTTSTILARWQTQSRWSQQHTPTPEGISTIPISLPAIREFRQSVDAGGTEITGIYEALPESLATPVGEGGAHPVVYVNGSLHAWKDTDGQIQVATGGLRCTCQEYQRTGVCEHTNFIREAARRRLTPTPRGGTRRTPQEREDELRKAQARAAVAAASDWTRAAQSLNEAQRTWRADSQVSYYTQPALFREDVAAALQHDEVWVPYRHSDVFDGLADPDSGQGFGLEIEFELPQGASASDLAAARRDIAHHLHREGITLQREQAAYGTSRLLGPRIGHINGNGEGTWIFERDGTVNGGELVTAVMFDEPETWQRLERAISIITSHGGIANRKTGLHVHVGASRTDHTVAAYEELARLMSQHEDSLYRLASSPARGTHRRTKYARPIPDLPPSGFRHFNHARLHVPRLSAMNFTSVHGNSGDHVEFRLFDGTLHAGAIQAHSSLAVHLLDAAERISRDAPTARGREEWGSHAARRKARGSRRALTEKEFDDDSATTRSLLDTLYRRREDKAQIAAIYARTRWSAAPR